MLIILISLLSTESLESFIFLYELSNNFLSEVADPASKIVGILLNYYFMIFFFRQISGLVIELNKVLYYFDNKINLSLFTSLIVLKMVKTSN